MWSGWRRVRRDVYKRQMLYSAKLNLGATIQDLQSKQVLQILAEPTITTISGEKASFLSGGQFPFPVVQPGSGAGRCV